VLETKTDWPNSSDDLNLIRGAGEYEVAGVRIRGISLTKEEDSKHLRTAYVVLFDELNLCFLPSLKNGIDDDVLEKIGEIDVLFINNGNETKKVIQLIRNIDPRAVVFISGVKKDAEALSKELGQPLDPLDRVSIKFKDLNDEETKLIWLTIKEK